MNTAQHNVMFILINMKTIRLKQDKHDKDKIIQLLVYLIYS